MTTNGILLSRKLEQLKMAGLTHINISLDTLHEKKFEFIAKRKGWSRVLESIKNSMEMDFKSVKVIFLKFFSRFKSFCVNQIVSRSIVLSCVALTTTKLLTL
jgi:hypothetical protein